MLTWTLAILLALSASAATSGANGARPPSRKWLPGAVAPHSGCTEGTLRQHPLGGARFLECVEGALRQRWCARGRVFSARTEKCLPLQSDPRESGGARRRLPQEATESRYTSRSLRSYLSRPMSPFIPRRILKTEDIERDDGGPNRPEKRYSDGLGWKFSRGFNDKNRRGVLQRKPEQKLPRVPPKDVLKSHSTCVGCNRRGAPRPIVESSHDIREKLRQAAKHPAYESSRSREDTIPVLQVLRKGISSALPPTPEYARRGSSSSLKAQPPARASPAVFPFSRTPTNFKSTRKKCSQRSDAADFLRAKLSTKLPGTSFPQRLQAKTASVSPAKSPGVEKEDVPFDSKTKGHNKEGRNTPPMETSEKTFIAQKTVPTQAVSKEPVKNIVTPQYGSWRAGTHAGAASFADHLFPVHTIQDGPRGSTIHGSGAVTRKKATSLPSKEAEEPEDFIEKNLDAKVELGTAAQDLRHSFLINTSAAQPSVNDEEHTPTATPEKIAGKTSMVPEPAQPTKWETVRLPEKLPVLSTFQSQTQISPAGSDHMSPSSTAAVATADDEIILSAPDHEPSAYAVPPTAASSTVVVDASKAPVQVTPSDSRSFEEASELGYQTTSSWTEDYAYSTTAPSTESLNAAGSYSGLATTNQADLKSAYAALREHGATSPAQRTLEEADVLVTQAEAATEPSPVLTPASGKHFTSFISLASTERGDKNTLSWLGPYTHATVARVTERITSAASYADMDTLNEATYMTILDPKATSPPQQRLKEAGISFTQTEGRTGPSPVLNSVSKPLPSSISTEASDFGYKERSSWTRAYTYATVAPFTEGTTPPASYPDLAARSAVGLASKYATIAFPGATPPTESRLREPGDFITQTEVATTAPPVLSSVIEAFPSSISTTLLPQPEAPLTLVVTNRAEEEPLHKGTVRFKEEQHDRDRQFEQTAGTASDTSETAAGSPASIPANIHNTPTEVHDLGGLTHSTVKPSVSLTGDSLTANPTMEVMDTTNVNRNGIDLTHFTTLKYAAVTKHLVVEKATDAVSGATQRANFSGSKIFTHTSGVGVEITESAHNNDTSWPDVNGTTVVPEGAREFSDKLSPSYSAATKEFQYTETPFPKTRGAREMVSDRSPSVTATPLQSTSYPSASTRRIIVDNLPENQTKYIGLVTPSNEEASSRMTGFRIHSVNTAESLSTKTSSGSLLHPHTNQNHFPGADLDRHTRANESTERYQNNTTSEFFTTASANMADSGQSSFSDSHFNLSEEATSYVSGQFTGASAPVTTSMKAETAPLYGATSGQLNDNASLHREEIAPDKEPSLNQVSLELHLSKSSGRTMVKNPLLTMHLSTLTSKQANAETHSEILFSNGSSTEHTTTFSGAQDILTLPTSAPAPDGTSSFTHASSPGDIKKVTSRDADRWLDTARGGQAYSLEDGETSSSKITDNARVSTTEIYPTELVKQLPGDQAEVDGQYLTTVVNPEESPGAHFTSQRTTQGEQTSESAHNEYTSNLINRDKLLNSVQNNTKEDMVPTSTATSPVEPISSTVPVASHQISHSASTIGATTAAALFVQVNTEEITKAPVCKSSFGLFRHPENCNLFVHCSNSIAYVKKCPANLHFNEKYMVCDYPYRAGCV